MDQRHLQKKFEQSVKFWYDCACILRNLNNENRSIEEAGKDYIKLPAICTQMKIYRDVIDNQYESSALLFSALVNYEFPQKEEFFFFILKAFSLNERFFSSAKNFEETISKNPELFEILKNGCSDDAQLALENFLLGK